MPDKQRILVVDDERQITRVLSRGLNAQGYDVHVAADGEAALQTFVDWQPDLVVTDLSMPVMGGLELCRRLRAFSEVPIIVLSVKGEERAKVEALDAGADDYVTKPFGIDELLARIRAILRRKPAAASGPRSVLEAGDFRIQIDERKLTIKGREVHLTPKEYDLMVHLMRHPAKVLTHHALLGAVWGGDYTEQNEYLRVFIGQLRKKIEADPANPRYILTEPWIGYRFDPNTEQGGS
ncbi:MAG TPA: response regulator transcription factor [Pyrinomonadaceae bacterium]|nr:response regulator transcription factor [Pyrinomonadaceae bacterium]